MGALSRMNYELSFLNKVDVSHRILWCYMNCQKWLRHASRGAMELSPAYIRSDWSFCDKIVTENAHFYSWKMNTTLQWWVAVYVIRHYCSRLNKIHIQSELEQSSHCLCGCDMTLHCSMMQTSRKPRTCFTIVQKAQALDLLDELNAKQIASLKIKKKKGE